MDNENTSINSAHTCQNCKNSFIIEPDDFVFYDKIKVPPPTFCPECRYIRRLSFRNNRSLYSRKCGICAKNLISMYRDENVSVYCENCYFGDAWDIYEYAKDLDFNKPFLLQLNELYSVQPRIFSVRYGTNINSEYSNSIIGCNNTYLSFSCIGNENIYYSENLDHSKDSMDSLSCDSIDNCYYNMYSNNNYNSKYLLDSENCMDSIFLFDCANCSNCYMSSNLRNQSYIFCNKKYGREEYLKLINEMDLSKYSNLNVQKDLYKEMIKNSMHRYASIISSNNSKGDLIYNSNFVVNSFSVANSENIYYSYRIIKSKDLMDCGWVNEGNFQYESMTGSGGGYDQIACFMCIGSRSVRYSISCKNCSDCFGCVGLTNASYCILNKQYSKDEYFEIIEKVKIHMNEMPYVDAKGRVFKFGEFFPYDMSPFSYNESAANYFFPLHGEDIKNMHYNFFERPERNYNITKIINNLPDDINDCDETILNEVIQCPNNGDSMTQCTFAYKITKEELQFYKNKKLPLPRLCPNCRHYERLNYRNPMRLFKRGCSNGCGREFETTYAPNRLEKVFCEKCYQQEVL